MGSDYFNTWELKQAIKVVSTDPLEAKIKLEEYLEKYPKDYCSYIWYSNVLITLNQLQDAEKILNLVDVLYKKNSHFLNEFEKVKILEKQILETKVRLLGHSEKYNELYNLCEQFYEELNNPDINCTIFYCKKKLNKIDPTRREPNSYIFKQIVDYQEKDFLEHIKKHMADYAINIDCLNSSVFVPNFPMNKVIDEIKKFMPSEKKLLGTCFDSIYYFKYNGCGRSDNKLVDYFKVVCFNNTNNIITLYPIDYGGQLPYVDLNYLITEKEDIKVKRKSQFEKFKNRYRRN